MIESTGRITLQIIEDLRTGDGTGLEAFIQRYGPRLLVFIRYRLGRNLATRVEPEDVLQDFCMSILDDSGRFLERVDDRGVHRAAFQMLEGRIKDLYEFHFKTQKRDARREVRGGGSASEEGRGFTLSHLPGRGESMTQRIEQQDEYRLLLDLLEGLGEEHRQLFALKFLQELTNREIAEELGVSESTVKRLNRELTARLQELRRSPRS